MTIDSLTGFYLVAGFFTALSGFLAYYNRPEAKRKRLEQAKKH